MSEESGIRGAVVEIEPGQYSTGLANAQDTGVSGVQRQTARNTGQRQERATTMRIRPVFYAVVAFGLVGCGSNPAVDACKAEIESRLQGKQAELDTAHMAEHTKSVDDRHVEIESNVLFNRGMSDEYSQTYICRVELKDASGKATARVVNLTFNW